MADTGTGFDVMLGGNYRVCDENWEDLPVAVGATYSVGGGNDPTIITYPTTIPLPEFAAGDELGFTVQLPHARKAGTDLKLHLHWTPHSRGVAENGNTVNWRVAYSAANVGDNFPAETIADLTDTCDGVDAKHQITSSVTISGASLGISAMIIGRVYRLAGDTWATNTNGNKPALVEVDFHYQIDSPGSDAEISKSF